MKAMKANKAKKGKAINGGKASMSFDMNGRAADKKISSASADAVLGRYLVMSRDSLWFFGSV